MLGQILVILRSDNFDHQDKHWSLNDPKTTNAACWRGRRGRELELRDADQIKISRSSKIE